MSYYQFLRNKRGDSIELQMKVEETATQLISRLRGIDPFTLNEPESEEERLALVEAPVAMVGQVQSGKTRAYLGVMAKCFDEGVDITIILTKSSVILGQQTIDRVKRDFSLCDSLQSPIGSRRLRVAMANELHSLEVPLSVKQVIIAIKDDDHLVHLNRLLGSYRAKRDVNVLLIDDEADVTSINYDASGFPAKVMRILFEMRRGFNGRRKRGNSRLVMLQVTATPAALYLQRDHSAVRSSNYITHQPDYTVLLDPHTSYVGGKHYFEYSEEDDRVERYLHRPLSLKTVKFLATYRDDVSPARLIKSKRLKDFREALITYIVAVAIRSIQEDESDHPFTPLYSGACMLHLDHSVKSHRAQAELCLALLDHLENLVEAESQTFHVYVENALEQLSPSLKQSGELIPDFEQLIERVQSYFNGSLDAQVVLANSDKGTALGRRPEWSSKYRHHPLLRLNGVEDEHGVSRPLTLDRTLNFFIGGDTFTRGVTLDHLICSLYGRSTTKDADSALQHCRWYGARDLRDLAVTRLYTTPSSYDVLEEAYHIDNMIRAQIIASKNRLEVLWNKRRSYTLSLTSEQQRVHAPSADQIPGKIAYLPKNFQLIEREHLAEITAQIDELIDKSAGGPIIEKGEHYEWTVNQAFISQVFELIDQSLVFDRSLKTRWHHEVAKALVALGSDSWKRSPTVHLLADMVAKPHDQIPLIRGDTPLESGFLRRLRAQVDLTKRPVLVLTRQRGGDHFGWGARGSFYWPVLLSPRFVEKFNFHHSDQGAVR